MAALKKPKKLAGYFARFALSFCAMMLLALALTIALYVIAQVQWIKSRLGDSPLIFVALFVVLFAGGAALLSVRYSRALSKRLAPP